MAGRKSDFTLTRLDDLFSTQEQRDEEKLSKIRDIPLELIDDFPDHPFKVRDDEDMQQLVESIKERGVITPATVSCLLCGSIGDDRCTWYRCNRICGERPYHSCKQSVRFHFRTYPCNRTYPARLRYRAGRTFFEVPRPVPESKRFSYSCRRYHHYFRKRNPYSYHRLRDNSYHRAYSAKRVCPIFTRRCE